MSPANFADLRQEAEQEVERLLTFLDWLDGDPDLEPNIGSVSCISPTGISFEGLGLGRQDEPRVYANRDPCWDQTHWAGSDATADEREADGDDREPEVAF